MKSKDDGHSRQNLDEQKGSTLGTLRPKNGAKLRTAEDIVLQIGCLPCM